VAAHARCAEQATTTLDADHARVNEHETIEQRTNALFWDSRANAVASASISVRCRSADYRDRADRYGLPKWVLPNTGGGGYYVTAMSRELTANLRDRAWPLITPLERRGMFEDLRRQVTLGRVPVALLMSFVPQQLASRDRHAIGDAIGDHGLPLELYRHVPAAQLPAVGEYVRRTLGARARELGSLWKRSFRATVHSTWAGTFRSGSPVIRKNT
jgi:hypothetical protein